MDLANIIALVSSANVDPSTRPEVNVEPEIVETVIGRNLPKPVRGKIPASNTGEQAAPIHNKPAVFGVTLPERNTLDAKGFLLACRDAGKRSFQSVNEVTGEVRTMVKVDQGKVREDLICAIHAYIGYDNRRDFGSQDQEARAKAQREIRAAQGYKVAAGPTREEQRSAARSMSGFVAGMPAPAQKLLANLRAREQSTVEAMLDAKTEEEKAAHSALLVTIRKAIDELL